MKTRYTHRSLTGQKKILLWCYGVWFLAFLIPVTIAAEVKNSSVESCEVLIETVHDKALADELPLVKRFLKEV